MLLFGTRLKPDELDVVEVEAIDHGSGRAWVSEMAQPIGST